MTGASLPSGTRGWCLNPEVAHTGPHERSGGCHGWNWFASPSAGASPPSPTTPAPRCECGHIMALHTSNGLGMCKLAISDCGCNAYRVALARPAAPLGELASYIAQLVTSEIGDVLAEDDEHRLDAADYALRGEHVAKAILARLASPPAGAREQKLCRECGEQPRAAQSDFCTGCDPDGPPREFVARTSGGSPETTPLTDAESLAREFHTLYEYFAPSFGYRTREASAKPWEDVPEQNRALMTTVCSELLARLCKMLSNRRRRLLAKMKPNTTGVAA